VSPTPGGEPLVQFDVELEDIDALGADEAECWVLDRIFHEGKHFSFGDTAGLGDASRLESCVCGRDVRVETTGGGGDGVGRELGVFGQPVLRAVGGDALNASSTSAVAGSSCTPLMSLSLVGPRFEPLELAPS
jgi:hypothetical protein